MSVSFSKFNSFNAAAYNKVHNLSSDTLMLAFCAAGNAPVATNTKLADLTEVSYTNMSSRALTTTSSTQSSGTYRLILADLTVTASGSVATFRYIVLYNNTATNKELIGYYDYGSDITLATGQSFIADFDNVNGVFSTV